METQLGDTFSSRRRIAIVVTLGLLTALGPFTVDLYLPAFPAIKSELSLGDPQVQLTLSATTVGFAIGQLLVGPVSDRLGRRIPLIVMTTLHVLASILVTQSHALPSLTGMRALQGIGAAGGAVVAMAMARDLFSGNRLVVMLSRLALINGLAPIAAPLVGSWLVGIMNWRGVFWFLASFGAIVVVLVALLIPETRARATTPPAPGGLLGAYRRVFSDRHFVGVWLVSAFCFSGLFSYVTTSSVLFQEVFGLSPRGFGAIFAVCSVGVFLGTQVGSRMAQRMGPARVLIVGTAILVVASALLLGIDAVTATPYPLVPAMFGYTFGFGFCMPSSQVIALQNHRTDSGVAASLMGALNMGMGAVVGPTIGLFELRGATPMAGGMLVCSVLATMALWLVVRPRTVATDLA